MLPALLSRLGHLYLFALPTSKTMLITKVKVGEAFIYFGPIPYLTQFQDIDHHFVLAS